MFNKLLIANRGEIACRIIKTAQRMNIATVAIYSEVDRNALHVQLADQAFCVGPAAASESYLNRDAILRIASEANVEAIHPGYGFLSENSKFALVCEKAGIHFIGPSAAAIEAMGSKQKAKALMATAKVPLIPGYHGTDQSEKAFAKAVTELAYPVLIKAAAGGGGKGMRVVEHAKELSAALQAAQREAQSSFGDATLIIEKLIVAPRHIEIQIFADQQGTVIHLYERDCSIQRRHQKIIEEAPAPGVTSQLRNKMGMAAIAVAKAINYVGAGTVEFLLDQEQQFYFMEMNTRLQVEHPVTEMITGLDLVEWQLRIAAGEPIPLSQKDIPLHGHAIEARIYAEDPQQQFLPSIGQLRYWQQPEITASVRIDSGVTQGDYISQYYDPMMAKVIAHGDDRDAARLNLLAALQQLQIVGVTTNCDFLSQILRHPSYSNKTISTGFIPQHLSELLSRNDELDQHALAIAALYILLQQQSHSTSQVGNSDPYSPWQVANSWRMNSEAKQLLQFRVPEQIVSITAEITSNGFILHWPEGKPTKVRGQLDDNNSCQVKIGSQRYSVKIISDQQTIAIFGLAKRYFIERYDPNEHYAGAEVIAGHLTAPMPATVVAISVKAGDTVVRGDRLIILEAMKMEHTIHAPSSGVIAAVHYQVGDQVEEGAELLQLAESST